MSRDIKWTVCLIAPGLVRLDTYEVSLGDEWRGSVLLDAEQARRLSTDLAIAGGTPEDKVRHRSSKQRELLP